MVALLAACPGPPLSERLREGRHSPKLFALPNGINEFELTYRNGDYYLFHHDFETLPVRIRRAPSPEALASAKDHDVLPGRYPTVIIADGVWHAWTWDAETHITLHYAAERWKGPYTFRDEVSIIDAADW